MPTVIDSLIVSLGLDPEDFKKGEKSYLESLRRMEKQSEKTHKSMQKDASELSDIIGVMTKRVLGLATAFLSVGAAKQFTADITKSDAAIGRLAGNIGTSSEELSMWQGIVKRVGGDSQAVAKSFEGITRSLEQFKLFGTYSESFKIFSLLGVDITKAKDFTEIMTKLSKVMQGMSKARAHELGYGMGLDNDLINILQQGPQAVQKYISDQRGIVTGEQSRLAQERQDSEAKLVAALNELGRSAVSELSSGIVRLNGILTRILNGFNDASGGKPVSRFLDGITPIWSAKKLGDGTLTGKFRSSESGLASLVRKLESGNNYGAINTDKSNVADRQALKKSFADGYAAKTINEVIADEARGRYQAAGAYQIRANTLSDAVRAMGLSGNEFFNKEMQDRIFNEFLVPRRMKSGDQLKGMINEFDALKGHESEVAQLIGQLNQGSVYNTSSHDGATINIENVNLTTGARNGEELGNDLRSEVSRNYIFTSQGNSAY